MKTKIFVGLMILLYFLPTHADEEFFTEWLSDEQIGMQYYNLVTFAEGLSRATTGK